MSQTTIGTRPYINSNLFTGYYLDTKVKELDIWEDEEDNAKEAFNEIQELYKTELKNLREQQGKKLENLNEDTLLDIWIDEVLETLGYGTQPETSLLNSSGFIDRLLFVSEDTRREGSSLALDENYEGMYKRATGILEAKKWNTNFSKRFNEQRQYRDASHQIKFYLERTPDNIDWGILTDGRKWRLYGTNDYQTETYYEVDLPELLDSENIEEFKYFYYFFRPEALQKISGTSFLEKVQNESEIASLQLGDDLQDNIFTALRVLGEGFIETNDINIDSNDSESLQELKESSLVLLYRLMFILYAEDRGLIHPSGDAAKVYAEEFSLNDTRKDILKEIDVGTEEEFDINYSELSTRTWSRLKDLFDLIDTGNKKLDIPAYNGGLFAPEKNPFLEEHEVSNRHLAEVIYRLSTTIIDSSDEVLLADYADLDTRHLGSIYEGLLEHQFKIAESDIVATNTGDGQVWKDAAEVEAENVIERIEKDELYVVNDEGERKTTGSYYTPDYVVTYIVEKTLSPLLDNIREDLVSEGINRGEWEYVQQFAERVRELDVVDPAMGSGHFLTRATGYLTNQVMAEVRKVDTEIIIQEEQVRRRVAKECIYGVDFNPMAVELAKLSMWLETLASDQPLAFLDHHLQVGNSLLGSSIDEIEQLDVETELDGQSELWDFDQARENTMRHLRKLHQQLLDIGNETIEDARKMREKYEEIQEDDVWKRLVAIANTQTAESFGVDVPAGSYEDMAGAINDTNKWNEIETRDWFKQAQEIAKENRFFNWELEYFDVFDDSGEDDNQPGFDVVLGNPPWLNAWRMTEEMPVLRDAIKTEFDPTGLIEGHWDLFIPFVIRGLQITRSGGYHSYIIPNPFLGEKYATQLRKHLTTEHWLQEVLDFGETNVFENVHRQSAIYVANVDSDKENKPQIIKDAVDVAPLEYEEFDPIDSQVWLETHNNQIKVDQNYLGSIKTLEKVEEKSDLLGQHRYVNVGATVSSKESGKFGKADVVNSHQEGNAKKFFDGNDLSRWSINWKNEWLDYREEEMSGPRKPEMFETDKVVVRKRTGKNERLIVDFDDEEYYCDDTIIVVCDYESLEGTGARTDFDGFEKVDSHISNKYLSALLNSNLNTWYFKREFATGALQGSFSDVWPQSVRSFPVYPIGEPCNNDKKNETVEKACDSVDSNLDDGVPIEETMQEVKEQIDSEEIKEKVSHDLLEYLSEQISDRVNQRNGLNLNLLSYIQPYDPNIILEDFKGFQPAQGVHDSILTEGSEDYPNLQIQELFINRNGDIVEISLAVRYKPEDEDEYVTKGPIPAIEFVGLSDAEVLLIESYLPVVIEQEIGDFLQNATKNITPYRRLTEYISLPDTDEVFSGLQNYQAKRELAKTLDWEINQCELLLNQIVYDLYDLNEKEIQLIEESI